MRSVGGVLISRLTEIAGLDNGGPDIDERIPLPSKVNNKVFESFAHIEFNAK